MEMNLSRFCLFVVLSLLPSFSGASDKSALELFGPLRKDMALGSPGFSSPRFSPDGKLLAFDACNKSSCENVIYDITNDRYFAYRDKQGRRINNVSFSPSGKKLTFVVEGQKGFLWWAEQQDRIAVGLAQGDRFTFITYPEGAKRYPEFWGEEAVLFIGEDPTDTGRRKSRYLYMASTDGKSVRPLFKDFYASSPRPKPLSFYGPSRPRPLWDGKHVVMSDYGFSKSRIPHAERHDVKHKDAKYQYEVLRISIPDETVTPMSILVTEPHQPALAMAAKRLHVVSRVNPEIFITVHDVFAVQEGKTERVSRLAVYIYGMDVSPDGTLLALVVSTPDRAFMNGRLLLYDTRNHSYRELKPKEVSELPVHIDEAKQR